ncbi:AMP-binding protein [Streptomyces sp. LN699]|uniref:AMP-binding protein n=1 Tax=Streptomyces sp. LN699 TaxID=3112981 RepID=UPI003720E937
MLRERAGAHRDRIAIVDPTGGPDGGRRTRTYGELDLWADRMAAGLTARGIGAGDRSSSSSPTWRRSSRWSSGSSGSARSRCSRCPRTGGPRSATSAPSPARRRT